MLNGIHSQVMAMQHNRLLTKPLACRPADSPAQAQAVQRRNGKLHMVSVLQVSTVLGAALEEQRKAGEWIEGVAIWVAVAIVIMVGECSWVLLFEWSATLSQQ